MAVLSTPRSAVQLASKGRPVREHLFRIALIASLGIAFVFLAALLSYVLVEGWPRIDSRLWENMPSVRNPDIAGAQSAITGTLWVISLTAVARAGRVRRTVTELAIDGAGGIPRIQPATDR